MLIRRSTPLLALLAMAACEGTGPTTGTAVSLTFASDAPAGAASAPSRVSGPMLGPITDGVNTLDISSVKVVLKGIALKNAEVGDCSVEPEPAGCESFRSGPVLVDVPVDGTTNQDVAINIPAGTYNQVKFEIHEVTGADGAFLTANPTMSGKSITVAGTYNGSPFTFETNLSQEQVFALVPNLVVTDGDAATNVTIRFDVSTWFLDSPGGDLFNPATASTGQPNESIAEENIKNSIKAFEDRDRDGDETDES